MIVNLFDDFKTIKQIQFIINNYNLDHIELLNSFFIVYYLSITLLSKLKTKKLMLLRK